MFLNFLALALFKQSQPRGVGGTALMKQMRGLIPVWVTYFINTRFLVITGSSSFLCCHHCLEEKKNVGPCRSQSFRCLAWTPAAAGANAEKKLTRLQDWSKTGRNPVKQSFCCSQRLDMQLSFSEVDADRSKGLSLSLQRFNSCLLQSTCLCVHRQDN